MNSAAQRFEIILNRIRESSRRLGRVPASIYALAFGALILIFALFYWFVAWLPPAHAFWYSSVAAGGQVADSEASILGDLRTELREAYRANGHADQVIDGWRMVTDRLDVAYFHSNLPLAFDFQMAMPFNRGTGSEPGSDAVVSETVIVYTEGRYVLSDVVYLPYVTDNISAAPIVGLPTAMPGPGLQISYEMQPLPTGMPAAPATSGQDVLPLSLDLYSRILAFGEAQSGYPAAAGTERNGGFSQMLGLSALTASLLPLGDVTPASALAYVSIWSERILGAILLALILNSLAIEIARMRRTGLGAEEPDQPANRPAGKGSRRPTARGPRGVAPKTGAAAARARRPTQTLLTKRTWWKSIFSLAKRGIILAVGGAAVLLTLAVLYAAGIYLWSMAQYESSRARLNVPPTPSASLTATAMPAATATPTARLTPTPFGTLEPTSPTATRLPLPTTAPYPTAKTVQGNVIAFITTDEPYRRSVWIANADGSGEKRLVGNIGVSTAAALSGWVQSLLQWSPDGKWISYQANYEIWLVTPDGSVNKKILSFLGTQKGILSSLSWSPDSSRIAYALSPEFELYGQRHASIAIVDVPSGSVHPLGDYDYGDRVSLSWTADGQGLWLNSPGSPLRLLDAQSGTILEQVPNLDPSCSPGYVYSLIWSPNGKWFAVTEGLGDSVTRWLCVYRRDGRPVVSDSQIINPQSAPAWDLAGNALYFVSAPPGQSVHPPRDQRLVRFDASTGTVDRLLQLPTDAYCAWEASLSPDGRTLEAHCRGGPGSLQSFLLIDVQTLKARRFKVDLQLRNLLCCGALSEWSSDSRHLIVVADAPPPAGWDRWPGGPRYTLYAINVQTGQSIPVSGVHDYVDYWELSPVPVK